MAEETTDGTSTATDDAQTLDDLTALQSASPTLDGEVKADVSVEATGTEAQPDSPSQFDANVQPPLDGAPISDGATSTEKGIERSPATDGADLQNLGGVQDSAGTQTASGGSAGSGQAQATGAGQAQASGTGQAQASGTGGALDGGAPAGDLGDQTTTPADTATTEASAQTSASATTTETDTTTTTSGEVIPGATDSTATPEPLTGGSAVPAEGTTSGLVVAAPALSLNKLVTAIVDVNGAARTSVAAAGDVVTFSVTVTNTGNTLLQNISVTDPLAPTSLAVGLSLNPGESRTYAFNYSVTPSDISNLGGGDSQIDSVATATSDLAAAVSASAGADISLPPIVADARLDVASAETVSGRLSATDPDSTQLTFALTADAPIGLTLNRDGSYTFTLSDFDSLAAGETETFVIPYSVTDESGNVSTSSFTITVTGTNDAPVATFTTAQSVNEDASITGQLTSTDADTGATASYALVGNAIAGLTLNTDGSWSFNAANAAYQGLTAGATQDIVVTYEVTDEEGSTDQESFTITVTGTSDTSVLGADTKSGTEDTTLTVLANAGVLANDSDSDTGDNPLTVTSFKVAGDETVYTAGATATIAGKGSLTLNGDGGYSFVPVANWNGTVPAVTYTVNTGSTSTLDITIAAVSDTSVLGADTKSGTEDTTLTVLANAGVLANDSDSDTGDNPLTVTSFKVAGDETVYTAGATATIAGKGSLTLNGDGGYSFVPVANWNGTVPAVTYTVNTGSTSTLDITIAAVSDTSVLGADTKSGTEDTTLTVLANAGVLANDSDSDTGDNPLTVTSFKVAGDETVYTAGATATIAGKGSLTLNGDGGYSFVPVANWNGTVPAVTYTVNTGSTSTLDITIAAVSDTSVLGADTKSGTEDTTLTVLANAGVLANDSDSDTGDNPLTVTSFKVAGDETVYTAGATATIAGKGSLTLNGDGGYSFVPVANWNGTVPAVTYTVNTGSTSTLDITIAAVSDTSVLGADTKSGTEDTTLTVLANAGVLANDSDSDTGDNPLTVTSFKVAGDETVYTAGATATIAGKGSLTLNGDGGYSFVPVANWNGTVPAVTYTVNTGSTSTLDITIAAVSDTSVLGADTKSGTEDTTLTVLANAGVLANDSDSDTGDNPLTVTSFKVAGDETVYTAGATATIAGKGSLTLNGDGGYSFVPVANWNGTVPAVTYTVNTGSTSTLDITIAAVSDTSVLGADTKSGTEDTTLTVLANAGVLANDSDSDTGDNPLTVTSFKVAGDETVYTAGATATIAGKGSLTLNGDGGYSFVPVANWNGTVPAVTYTVNTGSTSTLDITIAAVSDTSVLGADTKSGTEDTTLTVLANAGVLANDSDSDTGDNPLTVTSFKVAGDETVYTAGATATIAGKGSLTLNGDGGYSFVPVANWNGTVPAVTYTVNTGSTSTLDITIAAVSDTSVLGADTKSGTEDTTLTVLANAGVLANDSDSDTGDNPLTVTSFKVAGDETVYTAGATATIAGKGSLTLNGDGGYSFVPVANWNGTVPAVTYTVNTGSTSTLDITIAAVSDTSVLGADTKSGTEDTTLTVLANAGVLANDSDSDTGDNPLTVTSFKVAGDETVYTAGATATIAGKGSLTLNGDGGYSFVPVANWNGTVPAVTYTVNTGSTSTLDITIAAVSDTSVLGADTKSGTEDTTLTVLANAGVLANDSDSDTGDNPLTVTSFKVAGDETVYTAGATATIAGKGSLTLNGDGGYSFVPVANWNGTVPAVTYTVNTGSTSTLDITIAAVSDTSVLGADTKSGTEDTTLTVLANAGVLANDSDSDTGDNPLTVTSFKVAGDETVYTAGATATIAGKGSLTLNGDGGYSFVPVANWNGTVPAVTYTVNTGSTSTLDITIAAVSDNPTLAIQDQQISNEANLKSGASLGFTPGADATDGTGWSVTGLITTGTGLNDITYLGSSILTSTSTSGSSSILSGYTEVDGSAGYTAGDNLVFTLTASPGAGRGTYEFKLYQAIDNTISSTPITGASASGSSPQPFQILSGSGQNLAVLSGWSSTNLANPWASNSLTTGNMQGSTVGWGINNGALNNGEMMRFDFGALNDFDGVNGSFTNPNTTLAQNATQVTIGFVGLSAANNVMIKAYYTDGTSSAVTTVSGSSASATQAIINTKAGSTIDYIEVFGKDVGGGGVKVTLDSVNISSLTIDKILTFSATVTEADGGTKDDTFTINVKTGAVPFGNVSPIILDLNGDGVQYVGLQAGLRYDFNGDGIAEQTAWATPQDGILAQMSADGSLKIVFSTAPGETDIEGLAKVYDTNQDQVFTIADKDFSAFGVWQDKDGDAVFDAGEFVSLQDAGIAAISLTTDGQTLLAAGGDVTVFGTGTYLRLDGSTGELTDVAFRTMEAPATEPLTSDHPDAVYAQMDMSALSAPTSNGIDPIDIVWQGHSSDPHGWTDEVLAVDRLDAPGGSGEPGDWTLHVDHGDGFAPYVPSSAEHEANNVLLSTLADVKLDFISATGEHQEVLVSDVAKIVWGGQ